MELQRPTKFIYFPIRSKVTITYDIHGTVLTTLMQQMNVMEVQTFLLQLCE